MRLEQHRGGDRNTQVIEASDRDRKPLVFIGMQPAPPPIYPREGMGRR